MASACLMLACLFDDDVKVCSLAQFPDGRIVSGSWDSYVDHNNQLHTRQMVGIDIDAYHQYSRVGVCTARFASGITHNVRKLSSALPIVQCGICWL
jgi:hypothetical protein